MDDPIDSSVNNPINETEVTFLTDEEKQNINQSLFEKINVQWKSKHEEISNLQIEIERTKTNCEQQKFLMEKELIDLQKKLSNEGTSKEDALKQLNLLKEKVKSQEDDLESKSNKINSLHKELEQAQSAQEAASSQCTALASSLESKEKLNEVLKSQLQNVEEQLATSQQSKCDAMIQAEEAVTLKLQMQYKEHRFEQEKTLLSRQVELLQQQLEQRSEEVISLRRDHLSSNINLQSELSEASEEVRLLREEKEASHKILEEKTRKIEELLKSLNEMRESEARLESSYRKELGAQEKLASIYKQSSEDQQNRCDELEKAIEEMKQLLQEASEQYGALEKAKERSEEEAQTSLDQRDLLIKDLKEELQKVNELLRNASKRDDDCISELSPAASAASQLMSKGLTLSQLYTEYLNTTEKLFQAEEENKRITRYLEQILKEIEEKAPILRKQREDYERALETINTLHTQIDNSIEDLEKQRLNAEEASRRSNFLGRENERLNQQVKDLSKQVTVLLTQVEAARAGLPPPPLSIMENTSGGTSASDVIGQHLVAFRDVSELQEKNLKLLASLRELSDKSETAERAAIEIKTQELQDELDVARKDLADLKASRERMQSTVENITRQRDMYRTLVNQQTSNAGSPATAKGQSKMNEELGKVKGELDMARKEIEKMKREHEDYRQERAKNDQMERNEIEKLKSVSEKTRNENIKLLSQAEYNEERLKTLQGNCEAYQRQVNALEEKCSTFQGIIGRHEGTIESLREHVFSLTKKLSQAEMMAMNLREEKAMLKESESRLLAERDSLHRSQYSQSILHSNLEAIKNNLEKNDSESRMRYENQISDLSEQCSRLKAKIESNMDLKEANSKNLSLAEQLKTTKDELGALKQSLTDAQKEVAALKSQLQEAQEKTRLGITSPVIGRGRTISPQAPSLTPRSGTAITHTVRELQVQLSEERAKLSSLQNSLDQSQNATGNLKSLVEQQDKQIKESTESNKAAQEEIVGLRKSLEEAKSSIEELEKKLKNSIESEKALKETMDDQLMRITEDLEERENELEEIQKKLEDAKAAEEKAVTEFKHQSKIALEMQDKYEREVMLHGSDLKALAVLKDKLSDHNSQIETITAAKLKAEESLKDLKEGFEDREALLKKTNEALKLRGEELDAQNKTLLDQFTQLSDKMSAIQTKLSVPVGDNPNTSFTEDEARSSDQLREVIKYLRREQEVIAGKVEVAQAEALRFEAQKKSLESQVDLLHKYLAVEKEKNQASMESASKYGELMRKVHTMDALADSNRLLREEKDGLKTGLEEARAKVLSLEGQITPLQEKLRELTTKYDCLVADKKSLESEKELYKKRSQELVEKLNKARPEDMIKLQQDLTALRKTTQGKDTEINRLKNMLNHVQKNNQAIVANKNQLQQQFNNSREEARKFLEENKKLSQEKNRLQMQSMASQEKIQMLEAAAHQSMSTHNVEQVRSNEQRAQMTRQLIEIKQKEDAARKEVENLKKTLESKEALLKEAEGKLQASASKIELLQKHTNQLRKIANKYKMRVESACDAGEGGSATGEEELAKEAEERKALKPNEAVGKKEDIEKLTDQIKQLKEELQKKEEEISKLKDEGNVSKLQTELDAKKQELQKLNSDFTQYKEKLEVQLTDLNNTIEENQSKKAVYESRIAMLERERGELLQQVETLNKKLSMQHKILENLQKQLPSGPKVSASVISVEKPSDSPPTANIKPMAAPIPTPAVSSPRSQGTSQGTGSRSIPTASIRPMAPTSSPAGQTSSSIGVVPPLETHSSGDGAVSSTVTLPQATVTPTPVAPASTTTQAFPPSLTATVTPTPVSQSSIASTAPFVQPPVVPIVPRHEDAMETTPAPTPSGSADALISQAIALVAPQVEDRLGGQKRKLEVAQEEDEDEEHNVEEAKRSRLHEEARAMEEEEEEEGEEELGAPREEDMGEPSSSSSPPGERKVEEEILIVSSDDEGQVPSSQTGRMAEDREENVGDEEDAEAGREAEAERSEGGEVPSSGPSLHPPPRPLHEPPSSSRQSLAPFHQLSHYDQNVEDRIVPSTPTLRACEGVSGFEFGSSTSDGAEAATPSNDGLAQIAVGGILDVTRMESLAQLDEGTRRSMFSSVRRSPAVEPSTEGNISSSGGDGAAEAIEESEHPEAESVEESSSHLEPDSVVQMSSDPQEEEVLNVEERDDEDGEERENVVSSQEVCEEEEGRAASEDDPECLPQEEEGDPEDPVEEGDGTGNEDEDDDAALPPPTRATRSSAAGQPQQARRITPVTWNGGGRTPRGSQSRGSRGSMNSRGPGSGVGRFQGARGSQRARRSRPGHGRGGSPS